MKFKCKCGKLMDEAIHFDYGNKTYEISLTCTCRKSAQHIYIKMDKCNGKLIPEVASSCVENFR